MTHVADPPAPPPGAPVGCARHPDRPTGMRCMRCERPACPDCLREASVGYQCVDCAPGGQRGARRAVTVAGVKPGVSPLVVQVLIGLNLLVFGWTVAQAGSVSNNHAAALFRHWALVPILVGDGEWWRVLTSGFLHAGLVHLAFNMLALWVIGRELERVLGRGRFLAVYLVSLLGGSAAVMLFQPTDARVAGASGAVFGLMGALAVVLRRLRAPSGQVIALIVVNIVLSVVIPNISLLAHLGGLAVGATATALLVYAPTRNRTGVQAAALTALVLLLGMVIIGVGVFS